MGRTTESGPAGSGEEMSEQESAEQYALVRLEGAERMVAEASTVEQVKDLRDNAEAVRVYLSQERMRRKRRARAKWVQCLFWVCLAWVGFGFIGRLSFVYPKMHMAPAVMLLGALADLAVCPSTWVTILLGIILHRQKRRKE
jgi:hypothetical protein